MNAKKEKVAFDMTGAAALRPAAIAESKSANGSMAAYGRSMIGASPEEIDAELATFKAEGGNPSYASAIKRIALGNANGDAGAENVLTVAYASQTTKAKAERTPGAAKPAKVMTALQVYMLWANLDDAGKKEVRNLILKHK